MLIFIPIQDLHPSDTYTEKKSDQKNSSYHPDTDGGRTDGRTDEQGESSIPPLNLVGGGIISNFLSHVTLKFDRWPWKTIGHLFYATSSFLHNFVAIGEFKLELKSGNAQFRSKSMTFLVVWPCNLMHDHEKTIGHLFYATSSFVHHFVAIGQFKLELQSGNA